MSVELALYTPANGGGCRMDELSLEGGEPVICGTGHFGSYCCFLPFMLSCCSFSLWTAGVAGR